MAYELTIDLDKINNIKFSYQVGIVQTTIPWNRPTYDAIKKFLRDDIVQSVLKKYDAYIIGAVLWNISETWDVDIFLTDQNGNHPNTLEEFIILENDLHILYDIALNKYSILVDVHYRTGEHKLPTKQQIIDYIHKIYHFFIELDILKKLLEIPYQKQYCIIMNFFP